MVHFFLVGLKRVEPQNWRNLKIVHTQNENKNTLLDLRETLNKKNSPAIK